MEFLIVFIWAKITSSKGVTLQRFTNAYFLRPLNAC